MANEDIKAGQREAVARKNANRSLIDSAFPGQGTPMDAKDHPVDSIQHPGVGNTPHTGISDDTIPFKE